MGILSFIRKMIYQKQGIGRKEPKHRIIRAEGDELFKQKLYAEAYEKYEHSYKLSLNEYGSSIPVLKRLVETADRLGNEDLVQKWMNECENLKKVEYEPEFNIFGRVILLLIIKRYSDAIVELNKIGAREIGAYDHHLRFSYYERCYRGLKDLRTALFHTIMKRIYLIAHHYIMWEALPHRKGEKANFTGSIFSTEENDRSIILLYQKCRFKKKYDSFKAEIENILGTNNHIMDKIDKTSNEEFLNYFKEIE